MCPSIAVMGGGGGAGGSGGDVAGDGTSKVVVDSDFDAMGRVVRRRTSLGYDEQMDRDSSGFVATRRLAGGFEMSHQYDAIGHETTRLLPQGVMRTFTTPRTVVACWTHFLVFDLFVGNWEARDAQRRGVPHWLLVPCLVMTLMFSSAVSSRRSEGVLKQCFDPSVSSASRG